MSDNLNEKMNMKKAKMGDVITDFQKSDAPQFKGKSMEKRRKMAIAAKIAAMEETQVDENVVGAPVRNTTRQGATGPSGSTTPNTVRRPGPGPAGSTTPNNRPVREPVTGGRDTVPMTPERQDFVNRLRAANPQTYGRPGQSGALRREDIINRVIDKYLPEADIFEDLTNEEILLVKLSGLKENHVITLMTLFQSLDENNQMRMLGTVETAEGVRGLLDFALENGDQLKESVDVEAVVRTIVVGNEKIAAIQESREAE